MHLVVARLLSMSVIFCLLLASKIRLVVTLNSLDLCTFLRLKPTFSQNPPPFSVTVSLPGLYHGIVTARVLKSLAIFGNCNVIQDSKCGISQAFGRTIIIYQHLLTYNDLHRVSKKLCKLIFCHNFAKFRPIVKIFGSKIAERTSFSEVYSFSTSPNLCQRTTMRNADVPNCYITL